jgi:dienelactone hydrolase
MIRVLRVAEIAVATVALACVTSAAAAGTEFPPPQGKGPLVVVASGMSGSAHYETAARAIAGMGYDVMLFDGRTMEGTHGDGLVSAIREAQASPHALPGKVALVGFSLGGGIVLFYGTQHPELSVGAVVWYPATVFIKNVPGFVERLAIPVVMFAGGVDQYRNGCCLASKGEALAAAAKQAGKAFELTVYPNADHDFVQGGSHYLTSAYDDALVKTQAALKAYFAAAAAH